MTERLDILYADGISPAPYESSMLGRQALGGTEAATIRVSEGLAGIGHRIAVYEHLLEKPVRPKNVQFITARELTNFAPRAVVHLRCPLWELYEAFPLARHLVWHHDAVSPEETKFVYGLERLKFEIICLSRWHAWQAGEIFGRNIPIDYIYYPLEDALYQRSNPATYNRFKLVWLSSPHKGLDDALRLFTRLRTESSLPFELHVYSPGYWRTEQTPPEGVVMHGAVGRDVLLSEIVDGLCVFYPSSWPETFGLIAAEANCLGLPVAGYDYAGLAETAQEGRFLTKLGDEAALLAMVRGWALHGRPAVSGNPKFRLANVLPQWQERLNLARYSS